MPRNVTKRAKISRWWKNLRMARVAIANEVSCLRSLQRSYHCTCGASHSHFPVVIRSGPRKFVMTHCGRRVDKLKKRARIPFNYWEQCNCIRKNLEKAGVMHLDIYPRNVCIRGDTVCLIDFDVAIRGKRTRHGLRLSHEKLIRLIKGRLIKEYLFEIGGKSYREYFEKRIAQAVRKRK